MRKGIGSLIGLGMIAFGVIAFIGQAGMADRSGSPDDFYAGLVMGGLLGVAGLVTLVAVWRRRRPGAHDNDDGAAVRAVGMTGNFDGDSGASD